MTTLLYGSIIQIRSTESIYENKLFYVIRLEEDEMVLKSNDGNTLILPIEDGSLGASITEIVVLYKPIHNFSVQNKLFKSQWVEVSFEDQTVRGQIVKADTVIEILLLNGEKVYIPVDRGLPKEVQIKKIPKPHTEEVPNEDEPELTESPENGAEIGFIEEEDSAVQYFYSIEQQTSDLLEHLMMYVKEEDNTPKFKNKMFKMIQRYKELRTKYTIFKDGIFLNKLPIDQISANAIGLNTRMYFPVSKDITVKNYNPDTTEIIGEYFRKVETEDELEPFMSEITQLIEQIDTETKFYEKNKSLDEVAKNHDFKTITGIRHKCEPKTIQDVYLYEMPNLLVPMTKTIQVKTETGQKKREYIGDRKRYMTRVDKPFSMSSFMMPPTDYIKYSKVYDLRSSILDKINLSQMVYYSIFYNGKQVIVNKTKKEYDLINKYTYYDNHSPTFDAYVKHITPSLKTVIDTGIEQEFIHPFYNFDQFINEISVTNINELKNAEFITANAYLSTYVKELFIKFKRDDIVLPTAHKFISTTITTNFTNIYKELMPKELTNLYFSSSELFKAGEIDNYQYYKSHFIKNQDKLDVTDQEIMAILDDIKSRVNAPVEETIAIIYKTEDERVQDRVLLKQVNKTPGVEHIFKTLIERGVDIRMDDVVSLIISIIENGYKLQKGMHRDIGPAVLRLITELKINQGDKAYVVESKKSYTWDKQWKDPEDPMCMIKKKMYKGDCGSLDKEREFNERIARLVFDIEQDKRREREIGVVDLELESEKVKLKLVSFHSKKIKNELKYNEEKRIYGVWETQKDLAGLAFSPYIKLRDKILSETDLTFKYKAMQLFIQKYTKRDKDPNWFYCIETSVKLMPTFFSRLADAFLRTENYDTVVSNICNEQGTLSDNGDKWVDKHSGYIIKEINFEEEYGLEAIDTSKDKPIFDDLVVEELQLQREINQNIKSLMFFLGVYPDETDLYPLVMKTYNALTKSVSKESDLLYVRLLSVMAHILVHAQTHEMKFGKSFPNCKFSFDGYPLTDDSNMSGVNYTVCVVLKLSKTAPWNVFSKKSDATIGKDLKNVLDKYVIRMIEIEESLLKKRIGLRDEVITVSSDWKNFSPRLKRSNVLPYDTKKLNSMHDYLDRAYYFSFKLQSLIHKHVSDQEFLLKDSLSTPYLVNTCCNTNNNVFRYFVTNAGLGDVLTSLKELNLEIHQYSIALLGTKGYFIENTRTPTSEPSKAYDEKTILLKLVYWSSKNPEIFERYGLDKPVFNNSDNVEKKIDKLKHQGIIVGQDAFVQMMKTTATIINLPVKKDEEKLEDDEIIKRLEGPRVNDYLFEETNQMIDKMRDKQLQKVLMFNRTCRSDKINLVISPVIEHYTHMNQILYNKINALLHIFPEMIATDKTTLDKVVKKHWLLAESHVTDVEDTVKAYYSGLLSLPHDERFKRDITIPLDRYKNLMKINISNQETLNLLYHYIFVHIIFDYTTTKNKNVDTYLKTILKLFEGQDKVLNYDSKSIEYEMKLSKKSETQIKTDYFKNLSEDERRSENVLKEHKLDKWGVGLQKSMFKYDKNTYSRDKQSAQEVINGLTAAPEVLDEDEQVNEEEGYDTREPAEDDDDAEYEEED